MNSHLTILINDKPMALPDDFSIDIEDKNPVFNDTEMFSYPFSIPLEGNRWLVKNIDDIVTEDELKDYAAFLEKVKSEADNSEKVKE